MGGLIVWKREKARPVSKPSEVRQSAFAGTLMASKSGSPSNHSARAWCIKFRTPCWCFVVPCVDLLRLLPKATERSKSDWLSVTLVSGIQDPTHFPTKFFGWFGWSGWLEWFWFWVVWLAWSVWVVCLAGLVGLVVGWVWAGCLLGGRAGVAIGCGECSLLRAQRPFGSRCRR